MLCFKTRSGFARAYMAMPGDISVTNGKGPATGSQWGEARNAANGPQCTGPSLTTKNYLAPNVSNAKAENF